MSRSNLDNFLAIGKDFTIRGISTYRLLSYFFKTRSIGRFAPHLFQLSWESNANVSGFFCVDFTLNWYVSAKRSKNEDFSTIAREAEIPVLSIHHGVSLSFHDRLWQRHTQETSCNQARGASEMHGYSSKMSQPPYRTAFTQNTQHHTLQWLQKASSSPSCFQPK